MSQDKNTVLLNGGGIANIAVLLEDNPHALVGFDTGPANGPIDEVMQHAFGQPWSQSNGEPQTGGTQRCACKVLAANSCV